MSRNTFFHLVSIFSLTFAFSAETRSQTDRYTNCLNYFTVGTTNCAPSPTAPIQAPMLPATPAPVAPQLLLTQTQPAQISPPTLDDRVDDFLANHGKPPREFVAFQLEPTLENALKWVHKYNQMVSGNTDLTQMWTQAEGVYDNLRQSGADLSFLNNTGSSSQTATPVATQSPTLSTLLQQAAQKPIVPRETRIGGAVENIRIAYYFSAVCPFCQRFEPELQQVLNDMPNISVDCIDMSPTQRVASNIEGKVNCTWRPLQEGEAATMGIRATPSLIIQRDETSPLERVNGYVSGEKLKAYLLKEIEQL